METSGHKPSKGKKQFKDNTDSLYIIYTEVFHLHFENFLLNKDSKTNAIKVISFPDLKIACWWLEWMKYFRFSLVTVKSFGSQDKNQQISVKGSSEDEMGTISFFKKWYLRSILTSSCFWSFAINYAIH